MDVANCDRPTFLVTFHVSTVIFPGDQGAARSLRLGDVAGSITVGKRADLVLIDTSRIGFAMQGSLADRVVNFATREDVDSVWIGGEARKRDGKMIGVDWAALKSQIEEAQARFGPRAASITFS